MKSREQVVTIAGGFSQSLENHFDSRKANFRKAIDKFCFRGFILCCFPLSGQTLPDVSVRKLDIQIDQHVVKSVR